MLEFRSEKDFPMIGGIGIQSVERLVQLVLSLFNTGPEDL
jgi:hypothetical protein